MEEDLLDRAVSHAFSSLLSYYLAYPKDRIQLLLQIDQEYNGILPCFRRIVKEQGVLALWRGSVFSLFSTFAKHILTIVVHDQIHPLFLNSTTKTHFAWRNIAAGILSGAVVALFSYPFKVVSVRLTADVGRGSKRAFSSADDCCLKLIRSSDGVKGLYRGVDAAFGGVVVFRTVYVGLYRSLNCSIIASIGASIATYPFDTVKKRMIMQIGQENQKYRNAQDFFIKIFARDGFSAFYQGIYVQLLLGSIPLLLQL